MTSSGVAGFIASRESGGRATSPRAVLIGPGAMQLIRMPCGPSSWLSHVVIPWTASLLMP